MRIDLDVLSKDGRQISIPIKLESNWKFIESGITSEDSEFNFSLSVPVARMNEWIQEYIKDKISNEIKVTLNYDNYRDDCFKHSIKFTMSSPTILKNIDYSKCTLLELSFYIYYDLTKRNEQPIIIVQPLNINEKYIDEKFVITSLLLTNNYNEGFSRRNIFEMWKCICETVCKAVIIGNKPN